MAEALVNHFLGDRFEAFSAGTVATRVNPIAALVLTELGIQTSSLHSKTLHAFSGKTFDHVITLCSSADEQCPLFFGGALRAHIGFDDPSQLVGPARDVIAEFRRVRDEIRTRIFDYLTGVDNE
jgi:arsenate reductase